MLGMGACNQTAVRRKLVSGILGLFAVATLGWGGGSAQAQEEDTGASCDGESECAEQWYKDAIQEAWDEGGGVSYEASAEEGESGFVYTTTQESQGEGGGDVADTVVTTKGNEVVGSLRVITKDGDAMRVALRSWLAAVASVLFDRRTGATVTVDEATPAHERSRVIPR
jgi:hypothetical protein